MNPVYPGAAAMQVLPLDSQQAQSYEKWIEPITNAVKAELLATNNQDGSHDFGHLERVSSLAVRFAEKENADVLVCFAAAMLHDIVNLPKNHPDIKLCSKFAAERAETILNQLNFPKESIRNVCHAIHAHSYSANIEPETIEAKCVQDADRMEALGAFGLMRVFYVSGQKKTQIMHDKDPQALNRDYDDRTYALDHFQVKLFKLASMMKTRSGKEMAGSLTEFLAEFYKSILVDKIKGDLQSGRFLFAETYYDAGKNNRALFNSEDPFAQKGRGLEPSKYAVDALLPKEDEFIKAFIEQLRFELNGYNKVL